MSQAGDREEWQRMVGEDLKELLDLVEETGIEELEVADGERAIRIRVDRSAGPAPAEIEQASVEPPDPEPELSPVVVRADRVGTFYRSADGDAAPLKMEGDEANAGEAIAFIDSLNILHELAAPSGGRIVSFGVEDGADVEYGQEIAVIELAPTELETPG